MALNYNLKRAALDYTKELMVAKMTNSTVVMEEKTGKNVALFMREVYDGFIELFEDVYDSD